MHCQNHHLFGMLITWLCIRPAQHKWSKSFQCCANLLECVCVSTASYGFLLNNSSKSTAMISPKKLLAMARKWQKFVANKKWRISLPRSNNEGLCSSSVANEGHFVVYTLDEKRFKFPLEYLRSNIFVELFKLSEEEFGLPIEKAYYIAL